MFLLRFGISPSDTDILHETYNKWELEWFIKKLQEQKTEQDILKCLKSMNESVVARGTGTKKGNTAYSKWRRKQLDDLEEVGKEDTVFNRLKRSSRRLNTLFDKLKHSK